MEKIQKGLGKGNNISTHITVGLAKAIMASLPHELKSRSGSNGPFILRGCSWKNRVFMMWIPGRACPTIQNFRAFADRFPLAKWGAKLFFKPSRSMCFFRSNGRKATTTRTFMALVTLYAPLARFSFSNFWDPANRNLMSHWGYFSESLSKARHSWRIVMHRCHWLWLRVNENDEDVMSAVF